MPLPATPWLNPPDYGGMYLGGLRTGAEVGMNQARLAASAQEASARLAASMAQHQQQLAQSQMIAEMETAAKMKIADQNARMEQQRIAVDNEYKNIMIGLQRQEIENKAKVDQMRLTEFADRSAAINRITDRVKNGGEDFGTVALQEGAAAGWTPQQMGPVIKDQAVLPDDIWKEADPNTGAPGHFYNPKSGAVHVPSAPKLDPYTASQQRILEHSIGMLENELGQATDQGVKYEIGKSIALKQRKLAQFLGGGREIEPEGLPMPRSQKELRVGEIYLVPRWGNKPGKWDGEKFVPL